MDNSAALLERVESCELGASALAPCPSPNEGGEIVEQSELAVGVWCHETACVEQPSMIGPGTRIGSYAHVMAGATVGPAARSAATW